MSSFVQQEMALENANEVLRLARMGDTVAYRNGKGERSLGVLNGWRLMNFGTVHQYHAGLIGGLWRDHIVPIDNIVSKVL